MAISDRTGLIILITSLSLFSLFVFPIFQEEIERGPQLSAYGEDWNDISDFRTQLEMNSDYNVSAILSNPAIIEDITTPSESPLIIAGAESPYSDIELDIIADYFLRGGNAIILGDFDYSNSVADLFPIEFTNLKVWDENYRDNVSLIEINAFVQQREYQILLNEPSTLEIAKPTEPLKKNFWDSDFGLFRTSVFASTSSNAWLDLDEDGYVSGGDVAAPDEGFPVGISCEILDTSSKTRGTVVFISDSSLLVDGMLSNEVNNSAFAMDLISTLIPQNGTILFDESRHSQDGLGSSLYKTALGFYFLLSGDTQILQIIRFNVLISVLIFTLVLSVRQPKPTRWRHPYFMDPEVNLGRYRPLKVQDLQDVLLERLRLKYNIYEFDSLDFHSRLRTIENVVKRYKIVLDMELIKLLIKPEQIPKTRYRKVAKNIQELSL